MKHLNIKKCLQHAKWKGDTLQCSCGRILALRYMVDKEVRLFTYGKFGKHKQKIYLSRLYNEIPVWHKPNTNLYKDALH